MSQLNITVGTGSVQIVQLGTLSAAVNQQITQAVATSTANAAAATEAAATATEESGIATGAASTATTEAAAASASASIATEQATSASGSASAAAGSATSAASIVAAIANGASTNAGVITGAEIVPVSRGAGLLQTTLNAVAQWVLQTVAAFAKTPAQFGAKGDGVTDDTAAFAALEATYSGRVVDLMGLTYAITAVPTLNAYHNGAFSVVGARQQAALFRSFATTKAKFHAYGGQLRALHKSLCNPLEQQTTIGFFGDSITWGLSLPENAPQGTRNGTLQDQRDIFTTPSWVNEFKRHIGAQYFDNAAPTLSNWSYSTAGQSTASYTRTERLYTNLPPFAAPVLTGAATSADTLTTSALLGYRHVLAIGNSSSFADVSFPFTGSAFNLVFTSIAGSSADYEIDVNGTSIGTFSSDTGMTANQQRRTHTFAYVRNGTIRIRAKYPAAGGTGAFNLDIEAVEVIKTCTIVNQGIIGTQCRNYLAFNFGAFGPSIITLDLNYVFMQLGTNDRQSIFPTNYNQPNGINNFKRNMNALLANITPTASVILMNALPALLESPPTFTFDTQDVRNMVDQIGSANNLDVIDNHTIFRGMGNSSYSSDGLHPNLLGHAMIAQNIINALESN